MKRRKIVNRAIFFLAGFLIICLLCANVFSVRLFLSLYRENRKLRLDPRSLNFYREQNEELIGNRDERRRIIFFGDSRIQLWSNLPGIKNVHSINRGIGSETTAQALLRIEEDVLSLSPELVVIQIGINDLKQIGFDAADELTILYQTKRNIDTIIETLIDQNIQVIWLSIFPVGIVPLYRKLFWSEKITDGIIEVNQYVRTLKYKKLMVVDCDSFLKDQDTQKSVLNPRYSRDLLHINTEGYNQLNKGLQPILSLALGHTK